jgi:hypothetical protein
MLTLKPNIEILKCRISNVGCSLCGLCVTFGDLRKIVCVLPEDSSTEPKHVAIRERLPIKDDIYCCVDGIYSNLIYTLNRMLNTYMKVCSLSYLGHRLIE